MTRRRSSAAAIFVAAFAGVAKAGIPVEVVVEGVRGDGLLFVALCSEATFEATCEARLRAPPDGGRIVLEAPGPGYYAVRVFHDADGDGELDRGLFGEPREGFGFSRDPRLSFGPPDFADVAFRVSGPTRVAVRMNYWS